MTKNVDDNISCLLKALSFAAHKHRHQRRKSEAAEPYINHPLAVAETLWNMGKVHDVDTILAAVLHDTLEDTDTSPQELDAIVGKKVRLIVEEVTDNKRLPKLERKRLQIENAGNATLAARHIKLADKICNIQDLVYAPPSGWSLQRQREYVDWAEQVVEGLRGTNEALERCFDALCRKARTYFLGRGQGFPSRKMNNETPTPD